MEHPELGLSARSICQRIELGLLTGRNIDLKRKAKFKARKRHKTQITDRQVFSGRLYSDFRQPPPTHVVEMDAVKPSRDSKKCILTFYFRDEKLLLAYLLDRCTKGSSFECLTQWDLNLTVNNINSVQRKSLLGLTPCRAAKENFDMDVLLALQLEQVDPDKINLTPGPIKQPLGPNKNPPSGNTAFKLS